MRQIEEPENAFESLENGKNPCYDNSSCDMVIHYFTSIGQIIYHILKQSLSQGMILELLKTAKITLIHRSGNAKCESNYRPIYC